MGREARVVRFRNPKLLEQINDVLGEVDIDLNYVLITWLLELPDHPRRAHLDFCVETIPGLRRLIHAEVERQKKDR